MNTQGRAGPDPKSDASMFMFTFWHFSFIAANIKAEPKELFCYTRIVLADCY